MITVKLSVEINGRTVEISESLPGVPALWCSNEREAAIGLTFAIVENMCDALDVEFACPPEPPIVVDSEGTATMGEPEQGYSAPESFHPGEMEQFREYAWAIMSPDERQDWLDAHLTADDTGQEV